MVQKVSGPWRIICFLCALLAAGSHLASLTGALLPGDQQWKLWHEVNWEFSGQQLTFVTSTMFTVDQLNMAISGRTNPTLTKMLLAYPLVSISWMIVIEKGVIFGHSYTEYLNHNVNNLAHLLVTLGCPSVRAQILQCGYKECFATVVQFVTMYYCWVWYCFMTLNLWPYDILDLRKESDNKLFGIIAGAALGVASAMYALAWLLTPKKTVKKVKKR